MRGPELTGAAIDLHPLHSNQRFFEEALGNRQGLTAIGKLFGALRCFYHGLD
jgi:hypothetical protein